MFVVANPVAHGARLARAIVRGGERAATPEARPVVVADGRLADPELEVDLSFPAVGVRSVWRHARWRDVRPALAAVRARDRRVGRVAWWYLVLAQSTRYRLAEELVRGRGSPGTLLVDFDRAAYARPVVYAARRAGWRVVTLVHGSPTTATYLPVLAQHVLVWGDAQREFFAEHAPRATTTVVGRPDVEPRPSTQGPGERLVVCSSLEDLTGPETARLVDVVDAARRRGRPTTLRLHPRARVPEGGWVEVAAAVDQVDGGLTPLAQAVGPGDTVVVVASTAAVDALLLGCDVLVVADASRDVPADVAEIRSWTADTPGVAARAADARTSRVVADTGDDAALRVVHAVCALSPPGP